MQIQEDLTNFEISHTLTFLDLFTKHDKSHDNDEEGCNLPLASLNLFEATFLKERAEALKSLLKRCGVIISVKEGGNQQPTISITLTDINDRKTSIKNRHLKHLIAELEKTLETKQFDFVLIAKRITETCKCILEENFEYLQGMQEINTHESQPFNEEWSAYFDIAFQTGAENHKMTIVYPNPSNFNEFQTKAAVDYSWKAGRLQRDYLHRFYRAFPHELIHCVQSHLKQIDPFPNSWSAEHDASYLCGSLLYQLIQRIKRDAEKAENMNFHDDLSQWYADGIYEELMVAWLDEIISNQQKLISFEPLYQQWKNAFGLVREFVELPPGGAYVLKDRIPFEVLTSEEEIFRKQIDFCFLDRIGDVYQYADRQIPDVCKVQPGRSIDEVRLEISSSSPFIPSILDKFSS